MRNAAGPWRSPAATWPGLPRCGSRASGRVPHRVDRLRNGLARMSRSLKGAVMVDVEYTDPMKFSYWAPLGSGGFVVSKIEKRTEVNFEANVRYIPAAQRTAVDS